MKTADYELLAQINDIIAGTSDQVRGLRLALGRLADGVGAQWCCVLLKSESRPELISEACSGLPATVSRPLRLHSDEGVWGRCLRDREPAVAGPDAATELPGLPAEIQPSAGTVLSVPLVVAQRAFGVLLLCGDAGRTFDAEATSLVRAAGATLAVLLLHMRQTRTLPDFEEHIDPPESYAGPATVLTGEAVTEGIAKGRALLLDGLELLDRMPPAYTSDTGAELQLFGRALEAAREDAARICAEAEDILAEAEASIFSAHCMLLQDPMLMRRIEDTIRKGFALRFSLKLVCNEFEEEFQRAGGEVFLERLADLKDILWRISCAADSIEGLGSESVQPGGGGGPFVVVARELLPSQLVRVRVRELAGIVCEQGGGTSHVAILAKALRIPMITGVRNLRRIVRTDDIVVIDCNTGRCYVRPDEDVQAGFEGPIAHFREAEDGLETVPAVCARTADGTEVRLGGNISLLSELPLLERFGAMGVGLYRTEFMFLIRGHYPTEEEQYRIFRRVVAAGNEHSVTVRVLDVGGDKPLSYVDFGREDNPFLGWRGVRFLLSNPSYLQPHLRAILRTTAHGRVDILLPMVADLDELVELRGALAEARDSLVEDGIPLGDHVRLGIMLEVPSAVWCLEDMLPHIDFVSIGTNDLTQYALAVDRGNSRVLRWYKQFHPVILRVIRDTCRLVAKYPGKSVSICGEMAGMPEAVAFLLGVGLRDLSMNPRKIPRIRKAISGLDLRECEQFSRRLLECKRADWVTTMLDAFAARHGFHDGQAG